MKETRLEKGQGTSRSQTAGKRRQSLRIKNKEQNARKGLENLRTKEQTARKRLENLRRRSKLIDKHENLRTQGVNHAKEKR